MLRARYKLVLVQGIFLGDEPELFGVTYADICALSLYLKKALLAAGRRDIFIYYVRVHLSAVRQIGCCRSVAKLTTRTTK